MPFLSHAGVSLRYDRTGSGPAVLLVHGWTANRTFWERQVHALRDRFTVIAADLRGHGESSPPRTGYSIGTMAGDLEHLVRALAVSRLAVVGWSMGGLVAQELARRLGDRVTALGLVCTTPGGLTDPKNAAAALVRPLRVRIAGTKQNLQRLRRRIGPGRHGRLQRENFGASVGFVEVDGVVDGRQIEARKQHHRKAPCRAVDQRAAAHRKDGVQLVVVVQRQADLF